MVIKEIPETINLHSHLKSLVFQTIGLPNEIPKIKSQKMFKLNSHGIIRKSCMPTKLCFVIVMLFLKIKIKNTKQKQFHSHFDF